MNCLCTCEELRGGRCLRTFITQLLLGIGTCTGSTIWTQQLCTMPCRLYKTQTGDSWREVREDNFNPVTLNVNTDIDHECYYCQH